MSVTASTNSPFLKTRYFETSVRRSKSCARVGRPVAPASETAISGQGFGLRWQNVAKSSAYFSGRIARLP